MEATFKDLINLRTFTTGRRMYAMNEVAKRARARDLGELAKLAKKVTRHDAKVLTLEEQWEEQKATTRDGDDSMSLLDAELDRHLSAFRRVAEDQLLTLDESEQKAVRAMLRTAFPNGVAGLTQLAYIDQKAKVGQLIRSAEGKHAAAIEAVSLGPMLGRLKELHARYSDALEARGGGKKQVDFSTVRAAREKGQNLMLHVVARILADHPGDKAAVAEARTHLLEPILDQDAAIATFLSSHRRVADVDPKTGTEVPPQSPE